MDVTGFRYEVSAMLNLTGREVEIIFRTAEHHYDGKCKSAAMPGPGAFVNGWKNRLFMTGSFNARNRKQSVDVPASWGELDTVAKILEMAGYQFDNAEVGPLRTAVHRAMLSIKDEHQYITDNVESRAM